MAQGNLLGIVVDEKDAPLSGATVTLIGTPAPLAKVTDAQGKFRFDNVLSGTYEVSVVLKGRLSTLQSDIVITDNQDTETKIVLKAKESDATLPREAEAVASISGTNLASAPLIRTPAVQSLALSGIGLLFVFLFYKGLGFSAIDLGKDEVARGVITYLVSVGTIMIAVVLVLSVILGTEESLEGLKQRFALGKEVLTILIGVLGTIIGFYYGSTVKGATTPSDLQMATVKITPDKPVAGTPVNFSTLVTGGEQPYTYSIKFYKDILPAIVNQPSSDGKISQDISIPANTPAGDISFEIEVKDKKGAVFTYNKNGQQKLSLQAAAPPTP